MPLAPLKADAQGNKPQVFLVCGPPGSGKTTYVRKHREPRDLTFDLDVVIAGMTELPLYKRVEGVLDFALDMRRGFFTAALKRSGIRAVWIISSTPDIDELENNSIPTGSGVNSVGRF